MANKTYDANSISVLEGLEAVRKRPGMYIGSTSSSGLHHLVYEIVDNSIDEALAGYCSHIELTIEPGDIICVSDNGRGIPVDIQPQTGKSALEVVFTVLHAGGKFGGGGYKVSGGLHGVGASVVNALSEWLTVQVHKDGKIHEMKFARGHVTEPMTVVGTTDHTGTTVTFKPDPEMFEDTVYNYDTLHTRMREEAFLNAGLRITIADERLASAEKPEEERRHSMCYEGGIRIPFIVRWPGHVEAGAVNDHQLAFYDVMPTFCELVGDKRFPKKYLNKKLEGDCFDGISFAPTLLGNDEAQKAHDFLYWEFHETDQIGLRMGDWKMVVKKGVPHLYNLAEDIHEDHDVAAQHPDLVNQMKQVILREHRPNDLFPVTLPK